MRLSSNAIHLFAITLMAIFSASMGALAQVNAPPIVYQQTRINIQVAASQAPKIAADAKKEGEKSATIQENTSETTPSIDPSKYEAHEVGLNVTIRGAEALERKDLFLLSPFNNADALMFVYPAPELVIPSAPFIQQPVDVLTINRQGGIEEILPNVIPAHLDSQSAVDSPVLAILFLKAGTVDKEKIKPKDRVKHSIFSPAPEMRQ